MGVVPVHGSHSHNGGVKDMAYQLIFTSWPTSLTMGRTGFSTVARTKSMPEKLAAAVERCGVYDILHGEIFSHRTLSYCGETWHILTRMGDSGTDYTNRNNYIAHHIAIPQSEIPGLANPAEILAQWDGWAKRWSGEPRFIGEPDGIDKIRAKNSLPAKNWERIFGSSAKAALLGNFPAQITASAGDCRTLLDLFSESLLLNVNPLNAWEVTFTTYSSGSENAGVFLWKAAESSDGDPMQINLTLKSAPPAPNTRAAEYASTGILTNRERLNLKVSKPKAPTRYKVVYVKKRGVPKIFLLYAASAAITAGTIAAAAFLYMEPADSLKENAVQASPEPLPVLEALSESNPEKRAAEGQSESSARAKTLSETISEAREKVGKDDFEGAVRLWDESPYAASNPSVKRDILEDIGARADSLMRYAENAFALGGRDEKAEGKAIVNMAKARRALDIPGISRKEAREKKWKTLNGKIGK